MAGNCRPPAARRRGGRVSTTLVTIPLFRRVVELGLAVSHGDARRLVRGGCVQVNDVTALSEGQPVGEHDRIVVVTRPSEPALLGPIEYDASSVPEDIKRLLARDTPLAILELAPIDHSEIRRRLLRLTRRHHNSLLNAWGLERLVVTAPDYDAAWQRLRLIEDALEGRDSTLTLDGLAEIQREIAYVEGGLDV